MVNSCTSIIDIVIIYVIFILNTDCDPKKYNTVVDSFTKVLNPSQLSLSVDRRKIPCLLLRKLQFLICKDKNERILNTVDTNTKSKFKVPFPFWGSQKKGNPLLSDRIFSSYEQKDFYSLLVLFSRASYSHW